MPSTVSSNVGMALGLAAEFATIEHGTGYADVNGRGGD
jgi:hypothetical protein